MSCPHVSGAVVLLKEAFPQLGGDSLLYALYASAIDMGDPGEDNTFGRGRIDVLAAYNYLAQRHTPVPARRGYDLALSIPQLGGLSPVRRQPAQRHQPTCFHQKQRRQYHTVGFTTLPHQRSSLAAANLDFDPGGKSKPGAKPQRHWLRCRME